MMHGHSSGVVVSCVLNRIGHMPNTCRIRVTICFEFGVFGVGHTSDMARFEFRYTSDMVHFMISLKKKNYMLLLILALLSMPYIYVFLQIEMGKIIDNKIKVQR